MNAWKSLNCSQVGVKVIIPPAPSVQDAILFLVYFALVEGHHLEYHTVFVLIIGVIQEGVLTEAGLVIRTNTVLASQEPSYNMADDGEGEEDCYSELHEQWLRGRPPEFASLCKSCP